jgi:phytoene dehydrogenase-like protein
VLEEYENGSYCGGGLGGLATAALFAKAGFSVTFYEKRQTIGGRAVCKKFFLPPGVKVQDT